ncbi:MAG TPA: DUF1579 family protein [Candidatus Methanoperedens sp.]
MVINSKRKSSIPNPALKIFEKLIGKWELKGRTPDSKEDNITGRTTFEWMPGGFFLKSEGEINFKGFVMRSLEIIGYDSKKKTFSASVYASMSGDVLSYKWDIRGNTLIHSGSGATYRGTISEDGNTITGGWRPNEGTPTTDGTAYDVVMVRVR